MDLKIEFVSGAFKEISNIDRKEAKKILDYLSQKVANAENPRLLAKKLKGFSDLTLWRFRVGKHRIICDIRENKLIVLVLRIAHRKDVYR